MLSKGLVLTDPNVYSVFEGSKCKTFWNVTGKRIKNTSFADIIYSVAYKIEQQFDIKM